MRKCMVIVFTLCCIVANLCSQPCLKPTGVPVESDIEELGFLGLAYCLGVRGEQDTIRELNNIERTLFCNPYKVDARAAFEELKEYIQMEMRTRYVRTKKELDMLWLKGCFRILYDDQKYHEKVKEIFHKHCERCNK